ncbi:flagellar hook-associated protein FlgK [Roseibacterium sp. SDUM158016]|uniref:flagellar hook-associated protein FlgK n=1 Tax=Roseicyclus sediminis TaxID=2980997 RepID=UPI0021D1EA64|nr:flagellar hook-associated protein FlgK [Roseibacterium sp. SDUM158016]MCU4654334.1 flagellar hook-associated protein FlgK [Roseibacterium sp. SDUM158016]
MGITSALSISRSGLAVVEKRAEITAGNIANADNPVHTRKTALQATDAAGGVRVTGIRREIDAAVERLFRVEQARAGRQEAIASGLELYTTRLGQPGAGTSLTDRIADLRSAFTQLANAPELPAAQTGVLMASESLVRELNDTADALDEARALTHERIGASVATLNSGLMRLAELNGRIPKAGSGTDLEAALLDEAAALVDQLSEVADLHVVSDASGRLSIYTAGGTELLADRNRRTISFDEVSGMLLADGVDITPGRPGERGFAEGKLAGQIELLNAVFPRMQLQLDETARALIEEFSAADASLTPGATGLFVERGNAGLPASTDDLASRIGVNDAVRPEAGGFLWRLRDGVGAIAPGAASDATQPNAFVDIFETTHGFDALAGLGNNVTIGQFVAGLVADQQQTRVSAQQRQETLLASAASIEAVRSGISGVNLDDELQRLVEIEQAYAANSQVIRSLTEMLDTLLAAF